MIRFVVLDLGQVLASPDDLYQAPAAMAGADPDALAAHYWTDRRAYDTGIPDSAYWEPLLANLGVPATPELVARLAVQDAALWTELRPTALELLQAVSGWQVPLAILSNAPLAMGPAVRAADWAGLFEHIFISAELGLTKPDPRIYATVTAELGVAPGEIAFIDDREPNVTGASGFGWLAHLWRDDADSLAWLRSVVAAGAVPGAIPG